MQFNWGQKSPSSFCRKGPGDTWIMGVWQMSRTGIFVLEALGAVLALPWLTGCHAHFPEHHILHTHGLDLAALVPLLAPLEQLIKKTWIGAWDTDTCGFWFCLCPAFPFFPPYSFFHATVSSSWAILPPLLLKQPFFFPCLCLSLQPFMQCKSCNWIFGLQWHLWALTATLSTSETLSGLPHRDVTLCSAAVLAFIVHTVHLHSSISFFLQQKEQLKLKTTGSAFSHLKLPSQQEPRFGGVMAD